MQQIIFSPSNTQVFAFNCILDNNSYLVTIPYNVYRQNYYLTITDTLNNLVLSRPLVGSPLNYDINLVKNYFDSTLVFRTATQTFEINP